MKKITLLGMLLFFAGSIQAQRLEIREVPEAVMIAFRKANPGVGNPQWRKEKGCYQAKCMVNKTPRTFTYTKSGTPVVKDAKAAMEALPTGIKEYLDKNHRGAVVDKVLKIINANGTVNYDVEVNGQDLIFDANGKYLKTQKVL
jgi:hypothetical protein